VEELDEFVRKTEELIIESKSEFPDDDGIEMATLQWKLGLAKYSSKTDDGRSSETEKEDDSEKTISGIVEKKKFSKDGMCKEKMHIDGGEDGQIEKVGDRMDIDAETYTSSMLNEIDEIIAVTSAKKGSKGNDQIQLKRSPPRDRPSFDLHISQLTPNSQEKISVFPMQVVDGSGEKNIEGDEAIVRQPFSVWDPNEVDKGKRPCREKKLADIMRSPYANKKVSLATKRSRAEDNVASTIFLAVHDRWYMN
jgi:hypothetical protein